MSTPRFLMRLLRTPPRWIRYERWGVGLGSRDLPIEIAAPDVEASRAAVARVIAEDSEEWRAEREAMREYG